MSPSRGSSSPNGTNAATRAGDGPLALVSGGQPSSPNSELGTTEVAQVLRRSPAWVKRHAQELGGRLVDGCYAFPSVAIERRRTTVEKITVGSGSKPDRAREAGVLAARAFALFASCVPLDDAVVKLEAEPDVILKLHAQWLECRHRTAMWLASESASPPAPKGTPVGPVFDHPPSGDWSCCPGHEAMHRMERR